MKDFLRKFIYTGVGLVSLTADKFKETVDKLIEDGKMSKTDGKKAIDDFIENVGTKKDELEDQFDNLINKLVENFSFADKDEVGLLEKRISELEKEPKKEKVSRKPVKKKITKKPIKKTISKAKKTKTKSPKEDNKQ